MAKITRKLSRKTLMLSAGVLLILLLTGLGWAYWHNKYAPTTPTTEGNLSPATAAEQQAAADTKNKIVQDQTNQAATPSAGTKNVSVVITSATSTDVRGYTYGVFEDAGTCTATATKGSQTFTKTSVGFKNVSYTSCSPIHWDPPLALGSWIINLSYKSATAQGSASQAIEVK